MRDLRVERGCRNPDPGDLMSSLGLTFLTPPRHSAGLLRRLLELSYVHDLILCLNGIGTFVM